MRITRDHMLIGMATVAAQRSTCDRKQVGSLIAREGRPVSLGYAGAPPGLPHCQDVGCLLGPDGGCIRTQHAEANAIAFAARSGIETLGTTLYTTCSPCLPCSKMILAAGITEVCYLDEYRIMDGLSLLRSGNVIVRKIDASQL